MYTLAFSSLLAVLFLAVGVLAENSATMTKVHLDEAAKQDGAVCLDGSAAVYYFRPGFGNGSRSFVLFLEGGGWCAGYDSAVGGFDTCISRSHGGLGSSKGYGPTMVPGYEGGQTMSTDPKMNPRFYNWNAAYAKYCDGASFSGNRSEPVAVLGHAAPLYFRGARIFKAIVEDLKKKGLGGAKEALLSGCSAGGLATYLHCDAFASMITPVPARCVADAGYFANIPSAFGTPPAAHENPRKSIIEMEYNWSFVEQQSYNSEIGVNQGCLDALGRSPPNPLCFFPEYSLQYMTTPLFVLQSGYDSWQTNFIWFTPDGGKPRDAGWHACAQTISQCNASQLVVMEQYHNKFIAKLAPMLDPKTPHGGFVDSCMEHCQSGSSMATVVAGLSATQTLAAWYDGKITAKSVDKTYSSGAGACHKATKQQQGPSWERCFPPAGSSMGEQEVLV